MFEEKAGELAGKIWDALNQKKVNSQVKNLKKQSKYVPIRTCI